METKVLQAEQRDGEGTAAARRLRKTGMIPAVMYSSGAAATSLALSSRDFFLSTRGCKPTQLYKFQSPSSAIDGTLVLIKEVQVEAVRGDVLHVDFVALHEGHSIVLTVGLELVGESPAVKENRAIINQVAYEIEIECVPSAIPSSVLVDISPLDEGESLHAADVQLPEGVKLRSLPTMTVVSALSKKELEAAAAAAEAATPAPVVAAAATPAAAPAAGAAKGGDAKK